MHQNHTRRGDFRLLGRQPLAARPTRYPRFPVERQRAEKNYEPGQLIPASNEHAITHKMQCAPK